MKPTLLVLLALLPMAAFGAVPAADTTVRVMTFNIRFDNPGDGPDAWPHRKDLAASMIRFHRAGLIGVQEALKHQLDDLTARLPGYAWVGVGRADGREAGEYSAILYRTDRFELMDDGTFWLSETPEVPGSKSWDAAIERIVTWAQFRDRETGKTFFHFNTHFDHVGQVARAESAKLILQRIAAQAKDVGLDTFFVTSLFERILDYSVRYQVDHLVDRQNPDRRRDLIVRSAYLGLLIFLVIFALVSAGDVSGDLDKLSRTSTEIFISLSYLQLALVSLLAPIFTAGAITQEKDSYNRAVEELERSASRVDSLLRELETRRKALAVLRALGAG